MVRGSLKVVVIAVMVAGAAASVQASPIQIDLIIRYFPSSTPPNQVFQDTTLSGLASFFADDGTTLTNARWPPD